ncbi:MAG: exodeoxyribonuclease VII small subunit [Actinobacteria bacterium]|nr:MAG: exodeoxyribonuclease VII small subunit [Actinomycetota bacterium]
MEQGVSFEHALGRLGEIVEEVRRKDTDLDRSLELLEEGIQLANVCTERIDHTRVLAEQPEPAEGEVLAGDGEVS